MTGEIHFRKYETRSPDYHYKQIDKKNRPYFNAYVFARYKIELELIIRISKTKTPKIIKILDIGCGDGALFYLFNQEYNTKKFELYGVDSSVIALKVAKEKNPDVHFETSDVYNLPFSDKTFDLIISSDVIEHLLYPEKMLTEMKRVGKLGSHVLIGTPIRYTINPLDGAHQKEYYSTEFYDFIAKFFENVKIIQSHELLYRLLYNKNVSILKWKKLLYRYIINFISIYFNKNPFLKIKTKNDTEYSYMFGIGKIKK